MSTDTKQVLDPQTFPVSADISAQADVPTRLVPSRRRVRGRGRASASPTDDERTELQGLAEKVAFLEEAIRNLSQALYDLKQSGVLIHDGSRTT